MVNVHINKPIRRICLWGGPCVGKSTVAASVFSNLKIAEFNVELVTEYIKSWVYENRQLEKFDQIYIFAKQQRLEDRILRAGVNLIVTDSPLLMQCVYAQKLGCPSWKELLNIGKQFEDEYRSLNILLKRVNGTYQQDGRWQNLEEAKKIDNELKQFMIENDIQVAEIENDNEIVYKAIYATLVKNNAKIKNSG